MKKLFPYSLMAILILAVALSGCGGGNSGGTPPASFSIAESLVPATSTTIFPTGINDSDTCNTVTYPYYIAKYEVTYTLWKEVYDWARSHGYTLNPGKCGGGHDATNGNEVFFNTGHESDPVTITWYDAVIWCNALTEYYNAKNGKNLDCVYKDGNDIIKNSTNGAIQAYLNGLDENNFNRSAKGFRLPTSMEWELAARYKGNDSSNGAISSGGLYWTPGNYASGATDYAWNNGTGQPNPNMEPTKAAAWYWDNSQVSSNPNIYSTHPVGQKPVNGNALGLYDMSGNVYEWCFDGSGPNRMVRGGSWAFSVEFLRLGYVIAYGTDIDYPDVGIRPVRTQ